MVAVHCGHVDVPDVHCLRVKVTVDGPIATGAFSGHSFFTTAPDGNWPASLGSAPNQFVLGQERSTTLRCVPSTIFRDEFEMLRQPGVAPSGAHEDICAVHLFSLQPTAENIEYVTYPFRLSPLSS